MLNDGFSRSASVLIVDDDPAVAQLLAEHLLAQGFSVATADSAAAMRKHLALELPDLLLLDVGLPDADGLGLIPELREQGDLGIVMLTVRDAPDDRSHGLDAGADDYLGKPFALREVTSRLRAVLRRLATPPRRSTVEAFQYATYGGWRFDEETSELIRADGQVEALTVKEARLWQVLAATAGKPVTRDTLSEHVRHVPWHPMGRAIDALVARLRARVEANQRHPRVIITVRNVGYMLVPDALKAEVVRRNAGPHEPIVTS